MSSSTSIEDLKNKGNEAFGKENFEEAITYFTQALELDPNNHILYSNRSGAYAKLEKYEQALEDANKVLELKPDWPKGYSRKGAALHGLQRYEEAAEVYKKGLELDPTNVQLRQGYQDTKVARVPADNIVKMFGHLFQGDIWTKVKGHPETAAFMNYPDYVEKITAINKNPTLLAEHIRDQRIMATFGMLAQEMHRQNAAARGQSQTDPNANPPAEEPRVTEIKEEMTSDSTKKGEDEKSNSTKKESSQPKQGQPPKPEKQETKQENKPTQPAKEETEEEKKKKQAEAEKEKGNAEYKQRNFAKALQHYDAAFALNPTNIVYLNNKAAVYFEMQDFNKCVEICDQAIQVGRENRADPVNLAKSYARKGNSFVKLQKLKEAVEALQKSITENRTPDVVDALNKAEKALQEQERASYFDPKKAEEAKERGNQLFKDGKYAEAIEEYSEAIKRNPRHAVYFTNRAACYFKMEQYNKSLADCEEAIKIDPTYVKAYIRKGHTCYQLENYARALDAYQAGLAYASDNQELLESIKRTEQAIEEQNSTLTPEERMEKAMRDPEIREILADPAMRQILEQMQQDPHAIQEHLKNQAVASKVQKLLASGILQMRTKK